MTAQPPSPPPDDILINEWLKQIEQAAKDPLFLADLRETMLDFAVVDAEGWEADE